MDATCTIQDSIHVFNLVHKYVSRILGTYHISNTEILNSHLNVMTLLRRDTFLKKFFFYSEINQSIKLMDLIPS